MPLPQGTSGEPAPKRLWGYPGTEDALRDTTRQGGVRPESGESLWSASPSSSGFSRLGGGPRPLPPRSSAVQVLTLGGWGVGTCSGSGDSSSTNSSSQGLFFFSIRS